MISRYTAPGTKIVCINDKLKEFSIPGLEYDNNLDGLTLDQVYTVSEIIKDEYTKSGFSVILQEIDRPDCTYPEDYGYDIARFRKLELPKAIMDCLTTTSVDDELINELEYI